MIAAVKVRSEVDARKKAKRVLNDLNLENTNQCVAFEDSESIRGMLSIVKDYIAFGEISEETVELLEERKGEDLEHSDVINLTPPTKGYKNTKKQGGQGGSLGKRDDMDELIQRMV